MRVLGVTQGSYIDVFIKQLEGLKTQGLEIESAAYVSFARHFLNSEVVAQEKFGTLFLKEWELFELARFHQVDQKRLARFDALLGPGRIWDAIICDRRLVHGRYCKSTQDYRTRFDISFLRALIDVTLVEVERIFKNFRPELALGFVPVTFGESLIFAYAKSIGVPSLQLRVTKIGNYAALHDRIPHVSTHFLGLMKRKCVPVNTWHKAQATLQEYRTQGLKYEGINLVSKSIPDINIIKAAKRLPSALINEIRNRKHPVISKDNHEPGFIAPWFFEFLHRPVRARLTDSFLRKSGRVITLDKIRESASKWAFYPLHFEPEIALQIYGRPYHKDQIELLRNIGASLPFGMNLLVKEHPRAIGFRPKGYYEKLLEIPNLYFVDVSTPSIDVLSGVDLVTVLSGVIGLEAAVIGKPVVVLGNTEFDLICNTMLRNCHDLFNLPQVISSLLDEYEYKEDAVLNYLSAIIDGSVPIDVYSVLLNKGNRLSGGREGMTLEEKKSEDAERLGKYTLVRIKEVLSNVPN